MKVSGEVMNGSAMSLVEGLLPRACRASGGFGSVAVCGALALGLLSSPAGLQGHRSKPATSLSSRTSSSWRREKIL